jgi:hypothetical protein
MTPPPTQPPNPAPAPAHVLSFQEWGWKIQLRRKGTASSLSISTPGHSRYSLEIDEAGNVIEYISGNYTRVVEGNVMEYTGGATIEETEGPRVLQSGEYTAVAAPQVHFNPEEFREGVPKELPERLKTD